MENKAKYLHSNNEKKEEWPSKKTNDVFISYRRASSTEANQRHSTSLARSIALELKSEGFTVYFDCWSNKNDYLENIKKSKYFFVLLTGYSWEKGDNKKRSNFEEEIAEIEKGIENGNIDKDNVWWIDIDKSASNKKPNDKEFEVLKSKFHIDDISTKKESLIKDFIDVPKNGNRRIIRKFPRFSHKQCEIFSWFFALLLPISIVMGYMLYQYSREKVIFAGGGTVQQYLHDSLKIDVDDFQLGSEYIHLPSTTAWQLLWDDINEDQPRQYCPIILSTNKIDTRSANIEGFKEKGKRIAEYLIDSIPLMVQVVDQDTDTVDATISLDSLIKILKDTTNIYEIWTTSKESGTYLGYKELLNDDVSNFNLDTIIKQSGGMKVFTPQKKPESTSGKIKIVLANKNYYYKNAKKSYTITDTDKRTMLYLYAYTIASTNRDDDYLEILPRAQGFFSRIGCDATYKYELVTSDTDTIVVFKWPPKHQ